MLFDGSRVSRLTSTSFGIWNSGTRTIYGRDIVEKDVLRLDLGADGQMLRATVEGETRAVNGATVKLLDSNSATIDFDYLDPGDGFRIQILHSAAPKNIAVKGTVRGLPRGIEPFDTQRASTWLLLTILFLSFGFALVAVGLFAVEAASSLATEPWWTKLLFGAGFVGFIVFMVWNVRRPDKPLQPPKIRGVPRAVSEDPILSPVPVFIDTPQGRVQLTPEHIDRVNRTLPK